MTRNISLVVLEMEPLSSSDIRNLAVPCSLLGRVGVGRCLDKMQLDADGCVGVGGSCLGQSQRFVVWKHHVLHLLLPLPLPLSRLLSVAPPTQSICQCLLPCLSMLLATSKPGVLIFWLIHWPLIPPSAALPNCLLLLLAMSPPVPTMPPLKLRMFVAPSH
jgi:hypothetical protein